MWTKMTKDDKDVDKDDMDVDKNSKGKPRCSLAASFYVLPWQLFSLASTSGFNLSHFFS